MLPQRHGTIIRDPAVQAALADLKASFARFDAIATTRLSQIARTFGAQDMFSDCANYQPGISKQVKS